jgi:hypothetical protein
MFKSSLKIDRRSFLKLAALGGTGAFIAKVGLASPSFNNASAQNRTQSTVYGTQLKYVVPSTGISGYSNDKDAPALSAVNTEENGLAAYFKTVVKVEGSLEVDRINVPNMLEDGKTSAVTINLTPTFADFPILWVRNSAFMGATPGVNPGTNPPTPNPQYRPDGQPWAPNKNTLAAIFEGEVRTMGNIDAGSDINVDGSVYVNGDVILRNADCAEEFDVAVRPSSTTIQEQKSMVVA